MVITMAKRRVVHRIEQEYNEKYGDIPNTHDERIQYILTSKKAKASLMEDVQRYKRKLQRIKWETYQFTIDMVPQSTARPRHTFTGRTYVPHAAERADFFENFVLPKLESPPFIDTPCIADIDFYERTPNSFSQIKKILAEEKTLPNITVRDVDNMLKAVLDMIQHGMLANDNQVYVARVGKWYSIKPRVEITLKYMVKDPYALL